ERVPSGLAGGRRKRGRKTTSPAAYPTTSKSTKEPSFDLARAYLQGWDFFAAMHHFELAQKETRPTEGNDTFNLYSFGLFRVNFWDAVQVDTVKHPIPIYHEFWGIPNDKANALDDYAEMSNDSKPRSPIRQALWPQFPDITRPLGAYSCRRSGRYPWRAAIRGRGVRRDSGGGGAAPPPGGGGEPAAGRDPPPRPATLSGPGGGRQAKGKSACG